MEFPYSKHAASLEETVQLAKEFAGCIEGGEIIVLNGNLGTGKTFFIKNVLRNLGIHDVSSPTFTLINEYCGKFNVYHFDFYRINKPEELIDIGYYDYFNGIAVIFIEWGDLFPAMLPRKRIEVNIAFSYGPEFKNDQDSSRIFSIKKYE
ncbi:MAG TPA: tRNA (adenosine(37)-N6)-threonylcarbamoyltransferase complex ATPase subunit type 1 TsaE [Ignavibacteriaceae bacterium]|nr:tRNA (adenosine(37)-N6)-threonylcarbamoyltransferase complex ATPase subunit type 1 TsaE [Ignavibacteriaceae bacterium]